MVVEKNSNKHNSLRESQVAKLEKAKKRLFEATRHYKEGDDDLVAQDIENGLSLVNEVSEATSFDDEKEEIVKIVDGLNSLAEKVGLEVIVEDKAETEVPAETTPATEDADFSDIAETDPELYKVMESLSVKDKKAYKKLIEATKLCKKANHYIESGEVDQAQAPLDQANEAVTEVASTEGLSPEIQASVQEVINAVETLKASTGVQDNTALQGDQNAEIPPEQQPVEGQPAEQQLQESNNSRRTALREGKDKGKGSLVDYLLNAANGVPDGLPVENFAPGKGFTPSKDTVGNPSLAQAKKVPEGRTSGVKKEIPSAEAAESKRPTIVYAKAARKRIQEKLEDKFSPRKFSFAELDNLI